MSRSDALSEPLVRLLAFAAVLVVMALLEAWRPRRVPRWPRARRSATNLAIVGLGALVVRLMAQATMFLAVPLVATAAALVAEAHGFGLLTWARCPQALAIILSIVVLDLAIWLQHVASHHVPALWRLHRMHHADVDFDVTTALRFHPVEIALSMLYKVAWVLALGAPALAVILFEVLLNGCAMFNHANVALPRRLDRLLRVILVTPDMHRVHHSVDPREHQTNFGFNLSIWDRLFGTYVTEPAAGHEGMTIGLPAYQSEAPTGLGWSLALPFSDRDGAGH